MLSDLIQPRIVELGKIKIGRKSDRVIQSKKPGGAAWSPPEKVDHFILTTLNRDDKGQLVIDHDLVNRLKKSNYADSDGKIRRLPIRLLSDDPEDIMQASYCWYGGRSCGARSDGKTLTWFVGCHKNDWLQKLPEPRVEPWTPELVDLKDGAGNRMFKLHATFNCVIASEGSRFGGVHKFRTTSQITSSQLLGGMMEILSLTGGILTSLPLQLVVRPLQVNPTLANGTKVSSTVYVVHVELVGKDLEEIQNRALKQATFMLEHRKGINDTLRSYRALLRAPGQETSKAEIADIGEEFHPEGVEIKQLISMPRAVGEPAPLDEDEIEDEPGEAPGDLFKDVEPAKEEKPEPTEPDASEIKTDLIYDNFRGRLESAKTAEEVGGIVKEFNEPKTRADLGEVLFLKLAEYSDQRFSELSKPADKKKK